MISNYFTLLALAREWSNVLPDSMVRDVYSPRKDELAIELAVGGETQSLRVSVRSGFHFVYRSLRTGRPRANVTTLFESILGATVASVEMNPSDRILAFRLDGERRIEVHLYGSRANVLVVNERGGDRIASAFKRSDRLEGKRPPPPKELPEARLDEALGETRSDESLQRRLSRLRPRFGKPLVREWMFRAGLEPDSARQPGKAGIEKLETSLHSLLSDLDDPSPAAYRKGETEIFSLVPLSYLGTEPAEVFGSTDEGVRLTVRRRAYMARLEATRGPLLRALERTRDKALQKTVQLENAIATQSRADEYEQWGHLLMANPREQIAGETITVSDILSDGREIVIPVKPDLTAVQNAERYYAKSKNLRAERATLDTRLRGAREDLESLEQLLQEAAAIDDPDEIERFTKSRAEVLRRFIGGRSEAAPAPTPFRRFDVGGFEVWVGRNAGENDLLTFDHASPHDLWFHARGVGGSHVVLRVPGRKTVVDKEVQMKAAAIAAWFSSARGAGLVPVIVTERKYVSKPKGSDPGAVRVHRENVLMVAPRLPT